ncbi:MAG: hypothetical protein ACFFCM_22455 [Promethearchaeota archaeon]
MKHLDLLETIFAHVAEFSDADEKTKDKIVHEIIERVLRLEENVDKLITRVDRESAEQGDWNQDLTKKLGLKGDWRINPD